MKAKEKKVRKKYELLINERMRDEDLEWLLTQVSTDTLLLFASLISIEEQLFIMNRKLYGVESQSQSTPTPNEE